MPAKSRPTKKKSTKSTRRAPATNSRARRATDGAGVYVRVTGIEIIVSDNKSKGGRAAGPFAELVAARSAAVDGLIEAIETAERHLVALKRAKTVGALRIGGVAR